jgi:uncharacterized protein
MSLDWLRKYAPKKETVLNYRFIKPFASYLGHASLWHFNRRSVSRGVGIGLLFAFIVPVAQIFIAAIAAVPARANLAVTILMTTITNPLTVGLMAPLAHRVGRWIIGSDAPLNLPKRPIGTSWWDWITNQYYWEALADMLVGPWAIGMAVIGIVTGLLGYMLSNFMYARYLRAKRKKSKLNLTR